MKIRRQRHLVALLLTATLVACGDDDDPAGPGDPFEQTITGTVDAFGTNEHTFSAPRSGTMTIDLTWPDDAVDLDLYLTDGDCVGYPPNDCTILDASDASTGNTESITMAVTNGADFKIWVDNFDLEAESTYTIEITVD